jgi:integrase/recombinase XerD
MKLSVCIHQFFDYYLPRIKGVSPHTIKTYRDTLTLFLPYAAKKHSIKIDSLMVEHLCSKTILDFLDYIQTHRRNIPRTRNLRLATFKSLAKMIRLLYPQEKEIADGILNIPQKRTQKILIGFMSHEEILAVFKSVDLKKKDGFRDYTILHLLADSGARASEVATVNLDYFDFQRKTLGILGKGNRFRLIELWPKTAYLINCYVTKYRPIPKPAYRHRLFINQRGEELTRHGIYRLCQKYLLKALPAKRLINLNPVHSFRHSCAINMLLEGRSITEIKNRLGHENIESTMTYLHLDLSYRRGIQKKFIEYTQAIISCDPKIEKLINWENKEETLAWLDSL